MSIITISRGSYSKGKEIGIKVAKRLGYTAISREIIIAASEEFNISEIKLARAVHDAPSIFERFTHGKERYISHIESTLLEHFQKDNIVYHGLAGHFFIKGISHVLKVRIISDFEERIRTKMERDHISREKAAESLKKDDLERRHWSLRLYGIDTWDASLYDLVVHVHKISVADAVSLICDTVKLGQFKTTPDSQKALDDLALAARVKASIVDKYPNSSVRAHTGAVTIHLRASGSLGQEVIDDLKHMAGGVPGVKDVNVHLDSLALFEPTP
jgi:cytidylate kinase